MASPLGIDVQAAQERVNAKDASGHGLKSTLRSPMLTPVRVQELQSGIVCHATSTGTSDSGMVFSFATLLIVLLQRLALITDQACSRQRDPRGRWRRRSGSRRNGPLDGQRVDTASRWNLMPETSTE